MIRLEARQLPSGKWSVLSPAVAILFTILVGGVLFAALGKDPVRALSMFLVEPFHGRRELAELALKCTPLVLTAIGLALCFRANVWNIGAEGQYLMGAIATGGLSLWVTTAEIPVGRWAFFPLVILSGAAGGAAWAAIVAFLRDRFHTNEILVSLMLVYVADLFLSWLVFGPWKDPMGFNFPQTMSFASGTELPRVVPGLRLHWGFAVALVAAVAMWIFLYRTYRGIQLQVGGPAPAAARYAGFSARGAVWTTLLVSGGLAGVAGGFEVAGPMNQLTPHVASGYGFTAIIVAFVGRLHPLGAILGSVLLSAFMRGGELAQSRVGLPSAVSGVFQGVLLVSLLAFDTLIHYRIVLDRPVRAAPRPARAEGAAP
ncbi:MAG: ABC transporter permease [Anaeromyxobacteraceae bacterium]